jgi:5-methyltetrahydrofolate--homocysteine methyltransferase
MKLGEQATSVFADAQQMLAIIVERNCLLKVYYGILFPNQVNDDDIEK